MRVPLTVETLCERCGGTGARRDRHEPSLRLVCDCVDAGPSPSPAQEETCSPANKCGWCKREDAAREDEPRPSEVDEIEWWADLTPGGVPVENSRWVDDHVRAEIVAVVRAADALIRKDEGIDAFITDEIDAIAHALDTLRAKLRERRSG